MDGVCPPHGEIVLLPILCEHLYLYQVGGMVHQFGHALFHFTGLRIAMPREHSSSNVGVIRRSELEKRPLRFDAEQNLTDGFQFGGIGKTVLSDHVGIAKMPRKPIFLADGRGSGDFLDQADRLGALLRRVGHGQLHAAFRGQGDRPACAGALPGFVEGLEQKCPAGFELAFGRRQRRLRDGRTL